MGESRFEEMRRYVGFDTEDERLLAHIRPIVLENTEAIVAEFYHRIRKHPDALAVFRDEAQIERQKSSLQRWVRRVFSGPYDEAYFAETSKIGHVHVAVGLPQRYMLTGMNVIRVELARVIRAANDDQFDAIMRAVNRALDLELAAMLDSYFWALLHRAQEAERVQASRRADRLAAIGTLAAGLAHEIRNPLNGAQLHLTLVERGLENKRVSTQELIEAVQVTKREVHRLSNLVTEFLDFARPQPLSLRPANLRELSDRVVATMSADAAAKGVSISAVGPLGTVNADVDKLTQVLLNLVRNAIDACDKGGSVVVRTMKDATTCAVQVEDDGVGIPDSSMPIFDPFFTTKAAGTGLGLSIAHRIVSDHDGTLGFVSRPGRTVFSVRLRAAESA